MRCDEVGGARRDIFGADWRSHNVLREAGGRWRQLGVSRFIVGVLLLTACAPPTLPQGGYEPGTSGDGAVGTSTSDPTTLIIGYNQAPDTLFGLASSAAVTGQALQFITPGCVTQLDYDYQPVCFEALPTFGNGGLLTTTVTVDPATISAQNPVLLDGQLVTDAVQRELDEPLRLPQLSATWTIKAGLRWEDGTPLTADDFVFTWRLADDPQTPIASRYTLERTAEVVALDARTVRWTGVPGYLDPTAALNFAGSQEASFAVYPAHLLQSRPVVEIVNGEAAKRPLSYGPFRVESYVPQEQLTLVRNPNYFRASEGLPNVERVIFKFLADENQLLAQLQSGDIDIAGSIGLTLSQADRLDELVAAGTLGGVAYVPSTTWEHIDFGIARGDGQPSFFDDVRVRQAFAYGIDRQAIVDQVLGGRTTVLDTFQPPDYWAYPIINDLNRYTYNPTRAKQLLDEAGWQLGADGVRMKDGRRLQPTLVTTNTSATRRQIGQVIQANLKAIGVDVRLSFVPGDQLFANGEQGVLAGRRFDMALYAWVAGPEPSVGLYLCDQIPSIANNWVGANAPGYCNPAYDRVAAEALGRLERSERVVPIIEAQQVFNRDLPALPLFQDVLVVAYRPGISGVNPNPSSFVDFHHPELLDVTHP